MSLQRYLNQRYLAVVVLLGAILTALISYMHWSGMDDTTEYYMLYEAESLSDYYRPKDNIVEFDLGRKEYYWGEKQLPKPYQGLINQDPVVDGKVSLYSLDNSDIYILPYYLPSLKLNFYVVHRFANDKYAQRNNALRMYISAAALVICIMVMVLIFTWNRKVTQQLANFDHWVKHVTHLPAGELDQVQLPKNVTFSELVDSSTTLQTSLIKQLQLQAIEQKRVQREKDFLSSLSHELRTPIAIIAAAIALLTKRDQLDSKDQKTLEKLNKASNSMKLLTNTLLQVWRKQPAQQAELLTSVADIAKEALAQCQSYCDEAVNFDVDYKSAQPISINAPLLQIVINNLLRNACQYNADNRVVVEVASHEVIVANPFDCEALQKQAQLSDNYGFGFGFYLVETICQQQGWQFDVSTEGEVFRVRIGLSPSKDPL